jgi:hypothetical protein
MDHMSHHYSGPQLGFPHGDARLDFSDLYAFPKPGDVGKSILIMNVHPSSSLEPPGPTTSIPFAPNAIYEFKIDTNGNNVADVTYRAVFLALHLVGHAMPGRTYGADHGVSITMLFSNRL